MFRGSAEEVGKVETFFTILGKEGLSDNAKGAYDVLLDRYKGIIFRSAENARYADGTIGPFKDNDTRKALVAYHKENLAARSPSRPSSSGLSSQGAGQGGARR